MLKLDVPSFFRVYIIASIYFYRYFNEFKIKNINIQNIQFEFNINIYELNHASQQDK